MTSIELDWDDLREIAATCLAPVTAALLDALDGDDLEDVLLQAVAVRDAAQAIIEGRVQG